jgi:hypothetical protein
MAKNIGGIDKAIRILLAMVTTGMGFYNPDYWWVFMLGFYPLFTAIYSFSPGYAWMGISTCQTESCDY